MSKLIKSFELIVVDSPAIDEAPWLRDIKLKVM